jgi:hypothetical protein
MRRGRASTSGNAGRPASERAREQRRGWARAPERARAAAARPAVGRERWMRSWATMGATMLVRVTMGDTEPGGHGSPSYGSEVSCLFHINFVASDGDRREDCTIAGP